MLLRWFLNLGSYFHSGFQPLGTMFNSPVGQSPFKTNIIAGSLRFNPLVAHYLFFFGLELLVKLRALNMKVITATSFNGIVIFQW